MNIGKFACFLVFLLKIMPKNSTAQLQKKNEKMSFCLKLFEKISWNVEVKNKILKEEGTTVDVVIKGKWNVYQPEFTRLLKMVVVIENENYEFKKLQSVSIFNDLFNFYFDAYDYFIEENRTTHDISNKPQSENDISQEIDIGDAKNLFIPFCYAVLNKKSKRLFNPNFNNAQNEYKNKNYEKDSYRNALEIIHAIIVLSLENSQNTGVEENISGCDNQTTHESIENNKELTAKKHLTRFAKTLDIEKLNKSQNFKFNLLNDQNGNFDISPKVDETIKTNIILKKFALDYSFWVLTDRAKKAIELCNAQGSFGPRFCSLNYDVLSII